MHSTKIMSPPIGVTAMPVAMPILSLSSIWLGKIFGTPRYFSISAGFMVIAFALSPFCTTSLAIFLQIDDISRSRLLTPDSLVYSLMILSSALSVNFILNFSSPCSLICFFMRNFLAMFNFPQVHIRVCSVSPSCRAEWGVLCQQRLPLL